MRCLRILPVFWIFALVSSSAAAADSVCGPPLIKFEDLEKAASAASSQDEFFKEFLGSRKDQFLPPTFVLESLNGELEPGISPEWPGPVLASLDGRLVMRWTCNRTQVGVFGRVDAFYFTGEKPPEGPYK